MRATIAVKQSVSVPSVARAHVYLNTVDGLAVLEIAGELGSLAVLLDYAELCAVAAAAADAIDELTQEPAAAA